MSITTAGVAAILAGVVPLASTALASSHVETVNIPVPKAVVATAFNAAFASMKVHVHNYGKKHGSGSGISWLDDESYVLLPNGQKVQFLVPQETFNVPGTNKTRRLKYYINDLNTQSIQATVNGDRINVDALFESQGEEVQAECIRRLFGKWKECSLDMERDIHINNAILGISFRPIAYKGSIAFANVSTQSDVVFKYDIKIANKLCKAFSGICGWIEGKIKDKLTPAIKNAAAGKLNDGAVKDKVANAVKNFAAFKTLVDPSWKVVDVSSSGSNFVVRVERPVIIDGSSVKKLSLKPVQSKITASCPATVQLAATIEMKHAVNGTGFLTYENGQKSGTFNWSAKKGQTVTSNVSRKFEGKPGAAMGGSAVMKVQWKGSDGKTYAKDSNKAAFTVACTPAVAGGGIKMN